MENKVNQALVCQNYQNSFAVSTDYLKTNRLYLLCPGQEPLSSKTGIINTGKLEGTC